MIVIPKDGGEYELEMTKNASEALKPCPFCGGDAYKRKDHIASDNFNFYWHVICEKCHCSSPSYTLGHFDKAIEAWNRRGSNE